MNRMKFIDELMFQLETFDKDDSQDPLDIQVGLRICFDFKKDVIISYLHGDRILALPKGSPGNWKRIPVDGIWMRIEDQETYELQNDRINSDTLFGVIDTLISNYGLPELVLPWAFWDEAREFIEDLIIECRETPIQNKTDNLVGKPFFSSYKIVNIESFLDPESSFPKLMKLMKLLSENGTEIDWISSADYEIEGLSARTNEVELDFYRIFLLEDRMVIKPDGSINMVLLILHFDILELVEELVTRVGLTLRLIHNSYYQLIDIG